MTVDCVMGRIRGMCGMSVTYLENKTSKPEQVVFQL